jgi:glycerate kinase
MRVLLAFDKFKDALTAPDACAAADRALRTKHPDWTVDSCPLADGGEGFGAILTAAVRGRLVPVEVTRSPRVQSHRRLRSSRVARDPARGPRGLALPTDPGADAMIAVIEMATASGLALLPSADRDPWETTSFGTGEMMRRATADGAAAILLGVGGSATHDLGFGALAALGFRFHDQAGRDVQPPVPRDWDRIVRITPPADKTLPPIRIACDVTNPLLGPRGAAAVYGPQKGLRSADHARLENASARLALLLCHACGRADELMEVPGTGAAGGISFGLMTAVRRAAAARLRAGGSVARSRRPHCRCRFGRDRRRSL